MSPLELIGRRSEIGALLSAAEAVQSERRAALALIAGEPGIGKSAVLRTVAARLTSGSGFDVIRGGLSAAEMQLTWAGLNTICAQLDDAEFDCLPGLQRAALRCAIGRSEQDVIDPTLVAFGFGELIRRRASNRPTVLLLDDLHWLDSATAAVVAFAIRASAELPVLTILAARPGVPLPLRPDDLLGPERTLTLAVGGISVAALHHLVAERCGVSLRRPDAIRLHRITGGNPLHAIEIGHLLGAGRELGDVLLPPSLEATIVERLADLPDTTVRTLEAVALMPGLDVDQLVAALPDIAVEAELIRVERAAFVEVVDGSVDFRHPLLRAGVLGQLGGVRRHRLARSLAMGIGDPVERSLLLATVAVGPDEAVADGLEQAGRQALAVGVHEVAVERFRRAAELTGSEHADALGRRLLLAAESAMDAGALESAMDLAEQARHHLGAADRHRAEFVAIRALGNSGRFDAAALIARQTADSLAEHPVEQLPFLRVLGRIKLFGDVAAAQAVAEEALIVARAIGDPDEVLQTAMILAEVRHMAGEPVDLARFDRLHDPDRAPIALVDAVGLYAALLVWTDRVGQAVEYCRRVALRFESGGALYAANNARDQLGDALWRIGSWGEAEQIIRDWLDANRLLSGSASRPRLADLAAIQAATGRFADAELTMTELRPDDRPSPIEELHLHAKLCFVANASSKWDLAVEHGRIARRAAHATGYRDLGGAPFRAELVEALLYVGAIDEADEVATELTLIADRLGLPRGIGESRRCAGLVRAAQGSMSDAIELLEAACAAHADFEVPLERARTLLASGSVLRRAGRRREAAGRLNEAGRIADGLGAIPWVDRARAELDRLGTKTTSGGTALTPTEERVAQLVSSGRTNAEVASELYVSLRTVESNLTRVYRKLGVRSRTELAARLLAADGPHDNATRATAEGPAPPSSSHEERSRVVFPDAVHPPHR